MSKEDTTARIIAWQSVRDRIPEAMRVTVDHIVRGKPFPSRKMWKEIDALLADTVAKSSGSITNLEISPISNENMFEQLCNYITARNSNTNFTPTQKPQSQSSQNYAKPKSYARAASAAPTQDDRRADNRSPSQGRSQNTSTHEDKSTWKYPTRTDFCYYHARFGFKAEKCKPTDDGTVCAWDDKIRERYIARRSTEDLREKSSTSTSNFENKTPTVKSESLNK